jgi:hypothetical protein
MGALGVRERGHGMVGMGDSGERHDEHCGVRLMMEFGPDWLLLLSDGGECGEGCGVPTS